jgi:hypothetical protein
MHGGNIELRGGLDRCYLEGDRGIDLRTMSALNTEFQSMTDINPEIVNQDARTFGTSRRAQSAA